ncbi:MAG TPA: UDP-2,3-diacylglucosamine diphosphatase [Calditrichaeota bacterium]|nr:UDP-2,3-diacylglucosamine diphosphatase [Calditrichota bacterium]
MSHAFFISDLHIGEPTQNDETYKQEKIFSFLKNVVSRGTHLFIVGDLFDFWYEYKYVIPKKHFLYLHRLRLLVDSGVEIHYLAGNHDFYLGDFFREYTGIQTWPEEYEFELDGRRFFLYHGDGVAKRDKGYRFMKKIFRNKASIWLYRWLHPDLGIPFARFVSGSSRKYTNHINLGDESDYKEFAEKQFARGIDYVMMGHKHNPLVYEKDGHIYINLGDWMENFSYAEFDGKNLRLKKYK